MGYRSDLLGGMGGQSGGAFGAEEFTSRAAGLKDTVSHECELLAVGAMYKLQSPLTKRVQSGLKVVLVPFPATDPSKALENDRDAVRLR